MSGNENGTKNDNGKSPLTIIPIEAMTGCADALGFGAKKYSRDNFKGGLKFTRLADAALRHIYQYISGEDRDKESGLSHLDHALASLAMLKYMEVNKPEMDDRFKDENGK